MSRALTTQEKKSLLDIIKEKGEFKYQGNYINQSNMKIGALLESSSLDCQTNIVSYNGTCEFVPNPIDFPQSTVCGLFEGSAKMVGINEFELHNPVTLKKR